MPRRKSYEDKNGRTSRRAISAVPAGRGAHHPVLASPSAPGATPTHAETVLSALAWLSGRGDGRYSVNGDSGKVTYHKWRWSGGPLAGRYVMYVGSWHEGVGEQLLGLVDKIHLAEAGEIHATLDRYR